MLRECRYLAHIPLMLAVAGCASDMIPAPEPPKITGQMVAPNLPPSVIGIPVEGMSDVPGAVKLPEKKRRGASSYELADEDKVHNVSVGVGGGTNGPQQVAVELPAGEHVNAIHWANPSLVSVKVGRVGSARGGRSVIIIKPLKPIAPRVEDVSIMTTERHLRLNVHVKPGRVANSALKIQANPNQAAIMKDISRTFSDETLCQDNNFAFNKNLWWAPTKVCALVTPDGTYQTVISFPRNIQKMPAPIAYATWGDGEARAEVVNFRVTEDRQMYIDNVWPVLRLNGDGGTVDIHRGGSK